jgi:hypothetical protein
VASHIGVRCLKGLVDHGNRKHKSPIGNFPITKGCVGSKCQPCGQVLSEKQHIGVRGSGFGVAQERVHKVRDIMKPDFSTYLLGDPQSILWVTRSPDTGFEECYISSG